MRIYSLFLVLFTPLCSAMTYSDIPWAVDENTPNIENMPPSEKNKWIDIISAKSITKQARKEGLKLTEQQRKQVAFEMIQSPMGLVNAINYFMAGNLGDGEYMYAYPLNKGRAVMVVVNENLENKTLVEQTDIVQYVQNYKKNYAIGSCPLIKEVSYPLRIDFFMLGNFQGRDYIYGSFSVDWNYCKSIKKLWLR